MYEVKPLTRLPVEHRVRADRSSYPFHALIVGSYFLVTDPEQWKRVRSSASQYNSKHEVRIHCTRTKEGLVVWRDCDSPKDTLPLKQQTPNEFEFIAWLASMQPESYHCFGLDFADRFDEFEEWTLKHSEAAKQEYDCERSETGLTVKRCS